MKHPKDERHYLNLGLGVQSTTLLLLADEGKFPQIERGIFADTQEEPKGVYDHLKWLQGRISHIPIDVVTIGRLGDHLIQGRNSTGGRFASIPAFTTDGQGSQGITRRQCSKEYKVEVITRHIRRELFRIKPGGRFQAHQSVVQYIGISLDEAGRAERILRNSTRRGWSVRFPLIEMNWTRKDCLAFLESRVPHTVPRSACVFCPYRSDAEWAHLQQMDPEGFNRAVTIDAALRTSGSVANRDMTQTMYLHRSMIPLVNITFDPKPPNERAIQMQLLQGECLGVCGV